MSIFKNCLNRKLCIDCKDSYADMAYDGCYYYFLSAYYPCIIKYNKKLQKICCKPTHMKYNSICYDYELNCFWVATQCCYKKIFKLDACLNPSGCVCIHDTLLAGNISGLSYDCCNDKLIVAYSHAIYSVDKTTGDAELIYENNDICITDVLSVCPGLIITYIEDGEQHVMAYKNAVTPPVIYDVPAGNLVQSIIYNPCNKLPRSTFDVLYYNRHCCPYIIKIPLNCLSLNFTPAPCNDSFCKPCPSDDIYCGCGCCGCCRCCGCNPCCCHENC